MQQIAKAGGSVFWAATGVFKIYDAENGLILSSEVVSTNGQGHGALVGFLAQHNAAGLVPVPRPPLCRLASSCLAVFPAVRMPLPQIIWLVGLFLTPTPTAIIMPTKQSTPAAPIPATRTKAAVPGAATDQKS